MKTSKVRSPINMNIVRAAIVVVVILIAVVVFMSSNLFYIMQRVEQQEVGVRFRAGRIVDVVGPGLYTDFGLYVDLKKVPSSAVSFTVEDDEIITKDKQRLGLLVGGDIFRPNLAADGHSHHELGAVQSALPARGRAQDAASRGLRGRP